MISKIPQMDKQLKNLFPAAIKDAAIDIFGEHGIHPVLLKILSAPPVALLPEADTGLSRLLHPKEAATLHDYRFAKRRSEYLTGRICAKMAIQEFLHLTKISAPSLIPSDIEIASTASGRPDVLVHSVQAVVPKVDISISHSGDYGVALATASKCGIDLQLRQASLLRVQEKYCAGSEHSLLERLLASHDTLTRLALLWAAKEAAKKALSHWQMPGFLDLELREIKNFPTYVAFTLGSTAAECRQTPDTVTVMASMFGDYALAICLVKEDHSNAGITRN